MAGAVASGLLDTNYKDISAQHWVQSSSVVGGVAVAAGVDAEIIQGVVLKPKERNGVVVIDNATVNVSGADATGNLQLLAVSLSLDADDPLAFTEGALIGVPITNTVPKRAGSQLRYVFEFAPFYEATGAGGGPNVNLTAVIEVRNNDAVNPHNLNIFVGAVWRAARRVT